MGTSVTRVADAASKTGISSLIGQTEGTIFFEGLLDHEGANNYVFIELIKDVDENNSIVLFLSHLNGNINVFSAGLGGVRTIKTGDNSNVNLKIAFAYKQNDFVCYINGVQEFTRTSGSVPSSMNSIYIGQNRIGGEKGFGESKQTILFKTRLTNAQLAELTA